MKTSRSLYCTYSAFGGNRYCRAVDICCAQPRFLPRYPRLPSRRPTNREKTPPRTRPRTPPAGADRQIDRAIGRQGLLRPRTGAKRIGSPEFRRLRRAYRRHDQRRFGNRLPGEISFAIDAHRMDGEKRSAGSEGVIEGLRAPAGRLRARSGCAPWPNARRQGPDGPVPADSL